MLPILTSTPPITPVQNPKIDTYSRIVGDKYYELSNHLGNVLSVVTDRKLTESGNSTIASQDFNSFSNGSADVGWSAVGTGATPSIQNGRLMVQATATGTVGVSTQVSLLANRSYAIQMYIAPPASSMPVSYTIKDGAGVVLAQQSVSQAGNYTLNISPTSAGLYTVGTSIAIPGGTAGSPTYFIDDYNATLLYQDTNTGFASMFKPDVVTYNDYYPFGMLVPNRHANTSDYRYGFQGQERDDEIKGEGNSLNYTFRMHDPRVGRFLSRDPLFQGYPDLSPYQFAGNSPIANVDLDGLERYFAADGTYLGQSKNGGNEIRIANSYNVYAKVDANGKRENGYIILASKSIRDVSFDTAGKVYATIYNREIKNKTKKVPSAIKAVNNTLDPNKAAHATRDTKEIVMNIGVEQDNQYLLTDYYNAENVLFHENKHIEGISSEPLEHFSIWKLQVQDDSYAKTTPAHKSFHNLVAKGYIGQMMQQIRTAVSMKGYSSPESKTATINHYYNIYKTSVEEFNKLTNSHEEVLSKEYFENHINNMAKEFNKQKEKKK